MSCLSRIEKIVSYVIERTTAGVKQPVVCVQGGPGMKADTSFSQKLKAGWTKARLMAYYTLTEAQYEKIMNCLKGVGQGVRI